MRILVEAYGCAMNRGEAEEFIDDIIAKGHILAPGMQDADAYAIFTCGVIGTTELHMLRRIREFSREPDKPLLVCGCLANICPDKIMIIAPHAVVVGPGQHLAGLSHFASSEESPMGQRRSSIGILPIASGCLGTCSYCITRNARGALRSRPPGELMQRLAGLVNRGAAEVQLCAQDTAVYGRDRGTGLAALVKDLESVNGDFMMRIGMMNPASVMAGLESVIEAFHSPKVFKFLHLPVQSGSDAVLESMGRRHSVGDFLAIVNEFRSRFPGITLSTDIIVGFPGETDEDFSGSLELMRETRPDIINVTRFSPRPGTEAYDLGPKVHGRKAKERSRTLTDLRFELTGRNYAPMKDRVVRAMATERRVPGTTFLRTAEYKPVVVRTELELGPWYEVKITGARRTHLSGKHSVK